MEESAIYLSYQHDAQVLMLRICLKHGVFGNPKRQRGKNQDPFSLAYAAGYQSSSKNTVAMIKVNYRLSTRRRYRRPSRKKWAPPD